MLGIAGLIFVIVAPIYVYRNAKQNGHNAVLWTLLALATGVGLQIVLPLIAGVMLGLIGLLRGQSPEEIQQMLQGGMANVLAVICFLLSIAGVFLIMRRVNTVRDTPEPYALTPPVPPKFD